MKRSKIHLINPFKNPAGGSEWRTLSLYNELKNHADVTLWCDGSPDPGIAAQYPIRNLSGRRFSFPKSGTLVFMGVYFRPAEWIWLARPQRVIVLYNTPHKERLHSLLRRFRLALWKRPELVYCSELSQEEAGIPGRVETSIVDLNAFSNEIRDPDRPFTVGRLSRANPLKHHPRDMMFYERLASAGCSVKVMGATDEMIATAPDDDRIKLVKTNVIPAAQFLHDLDVFFYRTDPDWIEPWGRVIVEAMASGLPIVGNAGGYTRIIDNGRNGFIFTSEEDAFETIMRLKNNPDLRVAVGKAARDTAAQLITPDVKEEIVNYYTGANR